MASQHHATLQFISASLASCGAVTITNPFDLVKTRRQLLNELKDTKSLASLPSAAITVRSVWRWEGLAGIQRGLSAAYCYQILMNGTRFMIYEPTRYFLSDTIYKVSGRRSEVASNAMAGAFAGLLAAGLGTPFNLIKTRLQSSSVHFATGYQHRYKGIVDGLEKILKTEGMMGLFRGVNAAMARTAIGSAVQLSTYDYCKNLAANVTTDGFHVHFFAALASGIFVCLAMNPLDVVMTRLFNQNSTGEVSKRLYSGLFDCLYKTVRIEGPLALMKGFIPHYVRIGPHTMLTLVLLEQVRPRLRPFLIDESCA